MKRRLVYREAHIENVEKIKELIVAIAKILLPQVLTETNMSWKSGENPMRGLVCTDPNIGNSSSQKLNKHLSAQDLMTTNNKRVKDAPKGGLRRQQ